MIAKQLLLSQLRSGSEDALFGIMMTYYNDLQKSTFDSLSLRRWINGRISFNKTPVTKALKQLEAWYGIEIKIKEEGLKSRLIRGDYQDAALQDILK